MNLNNPVISIIVPIYKTEKYLDRCLNSILNQTYKDFELLLIDDGSPDKAGELCDEYAKNDTRIKVFHKENGGVSSARNVGLENAIGEWIYFFDSDDEMLYNGLETLIYNITQNTILSLGGYIKEYGDGIFSTTGIVETNNLSIKDLLKWIITGHPYYQGYLANKLFRRKIIMDYKISFDTDIYFNEDRLFIVRYLCSHSGELNYIDKCIYHYYEFNGMAMSSLEKGFNKKFLSDLDAFCHMIEIVKSSQYDELLFETFTATLNSYRNITNMIIKWNVKDRNIKKQLKKKLLKNIPFNLYIEFYINQYMNMIKYKVKKAKLKIKEICNSPQ